MPRVLTLPREGVLIVATDLHGNLPDFQAVAARFESYQDSGARPQLLVCGDLVHGPALLEHEWPDYLGSFYVDRTPELLDAAWQLQRRYPDQVHYLLGNHEHAHVGGPRVDKFHDDEASFLEGLYPPGGFEPYRQWIADWPWAAIAPAAGLVFTHAAPHAQIDSAADLDRVRLEGYEYVELGEMSEAGPLGAILWARTTTGERAYDFIRALDPGARVAVYGHDPVAEGYVVEHEPLLCLSTSFACHDGDKVYLEWDLAATAVSAREAARAGVRRLHPGRPSVHFR